MSGIGKTPEAQRLARAFGLNKPEQEKQEIAVHEE